MKTRKLALLAAMSAAAIYTGNAQATPVAGLFNDGTSTLLSDNSADFFIDVDQSSGSVTQGDILFTIAGIGTIGGTTIGGSTTLNEVTVFAGLKIGNVAGTPFNNVQGIAMDTFTAAPLTAADAPYIDFSTGLIDTNGAAAGGTLFSFDPYTGMTNDGKNFAFVMEDSANNYDRDSTVQTGLDTATDGEERLMLSLDTAVDPTDILQVVAPVQFGAIGALPALTFVQASDIFIDGSIAAQSWPGLFFNNDVGGGNAGFSSASAASSWPAFDNIDFTLTANRVPEPGTVALLSLGMIGLGGLVRKKRIS